MVQGYCANWLGPYDFATIYDVLPLWNAGIDGTGVTIAIVGETDIQMSDVQAFRSFFGLPRRMSRCSFGTDSTLEFRAMKGKPILMCSGRARWPRARPLTS